MKSGGGTTDASRVRTQAGPTQVLLIEDNPDDAKMLQVLLVGVDPVGFRVSCAVHLSAGLQRLANETFDVILLDLWLPDSEGLETFRQVYEQHASLPVVILTALKDDRVALEAIRAGAQDYLIKGRVDGPTLARVMRYAIERKRLEEAVRQHASELARSNAELVRQYQLMEQLLAALQVPGAEQAGEAASSPAGVQTRKVLVIEDDPRDAETLRGLLDNAEPSGFEVVWEQRLSAGFKRLAHDDLDLLILDLSLQESRGFETFRQARLYAPTIPIVLVTDRADEQVALDAIRAGAQDYLIKGRVDGPTLARVMRYAIERKRLEEAVRQHASELAHSNATLRALTDQLAQQQKRLEETNRQLREMATIKDQFLSTVSHELRTPLGVIKESLALMLEGHLGPINVEHRSFLQMGSEHLDRLTDLINNLLDLSKIEAKKLILDRRSLDLAELVEETCQTFARVANERALVRQLGRVPRVFADRHRITQVLTNLLSNAIKFTPENGTITIGLAQHGHAITCSVTDTGQGIAKEDLGKLFQRFEQLDRGTERPHGTGLGLAICKELIELHHGRITAISEPGQGTTVAFTLPVYAEARAFQELFEETATEANAEGGTFGLIVIDAGPLREPGRHVPGKSPEQLVQEFEDTLRRAIKRGDRVLMCEGALLAILAITDQRGTDAMRQRLQAVCARWAERMLDAERPLQFAFGTATYPHDGEGVDALIQHAKAGLRRG